MNRSIREILIDADATICEQCKEFKFFVKVDRCMCDACESHKERVDVIQTSAAEYFKDTPTVVTKEEPNSFDLEEGVKNDGMGDTASDTGSMKQRWDLLPIECIEKIVEIYTFGAKKYGDNTWQKVDSERYYAALFRHIKDWRKGEIYDEESGLMHLAHAGWNVLALIWHEIQKEKNQEKVDFL